MNRDNRHLEQTRQAYDGVRYPGDLADVLDHRPGDRRGRTGLAWHGSLAAALILTAGVTFVWVASRPATDDAAARPATATTTTPTDEDVQPTVADADGGDADALVVVDTPDDSDAVDTGVTPTSTTPLVSMRVTMPPTLRLSGVPTVRLSTLSTPKRPPASTTSTTSATPAADEPTHRNKPTLQLPALRAKWMRAKKTPTYPWRERDES